MIMASQVMTSAPARGVKRAADNDLEREQHLSKRFDLLNLDNKSGKLYIPVSAGYGSHESALQTTETQQDANASQQSHAHETDGMEVEDTPNRIYINDLDAEIASLEPSTPSHPIFIPDIEKHLLGLPSAVLKASPEEEAQRREREKAMQMVVYGVPTSLTVSEEQDNVRRAIEDARRRVRRKMPLGEYLDLAVTPSSSRTSNHSAELRTPTNNDHNVDMMDET